MIENLPKTYEELSARLEKQRQQDTKPDIHSFLSDTSFLPKQGKALSSTAQTAPRAGRYDMLSSGRVIPKFESYTTGYNEEERLAQQQGTGEKWVRGAGKFIGKTGLNIADATAGTLNGLKEAITQKRFSAFYDNNFSKYLDDQRTRLENNLVNYYTQEERSKNFIQRMGTANFWANDFGDAMAFLAGAAIPEAVYATLTGGASLSTTAAKFGLRSSASALKKKTAKELLEQVGKGITGKADDYLSFRQGNSAIRTRYRDLLLQKTGDAAAIAGFTIRTSAFEAGMEARHNLKESMDSYMQYFQQENGRQPTYEEWAAFTDKALNAANGVFLGNLGILSVSNRMMFGKLAGVEMKSLGRNSLLNRSLGLGFDIEKGMAVAQKANKFQRLAGNTYQLLRKPVSEGLFEEGLQGVAGKTMQKYLEATYDPNKLYSEGIMASLLESINEQYTTKEGWDEILMGMLVGSLGGGLMAPATSLVSGQGVKFDTLIAGTFSDSYSARVKERNAAVEKANKLATEKTTERLGGRNLVREAARASSMMEDGQMSGVETRRMNFNYIMSQKELMDFSEMQLGFESLVDANPLIVQQKEELEKQGITEEQYKQTLKETFKEDLASVKKAENLVDSVNIQDIQTSKGNKIALREAMMWNIVAGRDSHKNAMTAARLIEQTTKQDGVSDILNFYANLEEESKQKVDERKEKISAREKARQEAIDAQNEIAAAQAEKKGQQELPFAKEENERKFREASERYTVAVQTSMRLDQEINEIDQLLESSKRTQDMSFLDFSNEFTFFTMDQVADQIDKLDEYVSTLRRRGQKNEADTLEELMRDFAINTNLYKEFTDSHRMMIESDFFASEQGRGLLGKVLGRPYSMPQELADAINEQNERFEPTLRRFGLVEGRAGDAIKAMMDNSTELSDREKFRAENALRITLNMVEYDNMVEDYRTFVDTMGEEANTDQEGGDTTAKAAKRNKTIGEVEAINEAIQQITEQIDYLRSLSNKERTAQIEEQISQLQSEINVLKEQASKKTTPVTKTTTDPITGEVTDVVEVDVPDESTSPQPTQIGEQEQTEQEIEDLSHQAEEIEQQLQRLQQEITSTTDEIEILDQEQKQKNTRLSQAEQERQSKLRELKRQETIIREQASQKQEEIAQIRKQIFFEENENQRVQINGQTGILRVLNNNRVEPEEDGTVYDFPLDQVQSYQTVEYVKSYSISNISENTVTVDDTTYNINLDENGNILSLSPTNNPNQQIKNNKLIVAVEIERNKIESSPVVGKTISEALQENNYPNLDSMLNTIYGVNYTETIDTALNKLYDNLELTDQEKLQLGLWLQDSFDRLTKLFTKDNSTQENELLLNAHDNLDIILSLLYNKPLKTTTKNQKNEKTQDVRENEVAKSAERSKKENSKQARQTEQSKLRKDLELKQRELQEIQTRIVPNVELDRVGRVIEDIFSEIAETQQKKNSLQETITTAENAIQNLLSEKETTEEKKKQREAEKEKELERLALINAESLREVTQKENELRELQEELSLAKGEITVLESKDFVRYDELLKEQQKNPTTFPAEKQRELDNLKQKVDRWIFASGLQTDGLLLSELLEQKAVLEATEINAPEDVTPISEQEIIEDNDVIPDKKKNANTHLGYFYDGVTVTLSYDETQAEINGVKEASLRENLILLDEATGEIRPITPGDIGGLEIEITETENGNIMVSLEVLQAISSLPNSLISFNFIGESIGRNYSPVVIYETDMEGNLRGSYMPVSEDFKDFGFPNSPEAVYETEVGDQPTLIVNADDAYNKKLIDNYKKALGDVESESLNTPTKQAKKLEELYAQRKAIENKKKQTANDKALLAEINKKVQEVVDEIAKVREKSKARKRLEEAKQDLQRNLRITAISPKSPDGSISTIAILRGRGQSVHDKEVDRKFQSWREQEIGKEEFIDALLVSRTVEMPTGPMTVNKVYPGMPNFVFQKTANGRQVVTYTPFTQNQAEKIVDIGYKEGGVMKTRNKTKGLDTTFLKKFSEKGKQRTPFVVIQQGKKLIAYPVRVGQLSKPDTKDLIDTFNAQNDPVKKAVALNKLIAQKGLDVKQAGNAFFVGTGGINNLTQENLDNIISKINSIEYLYPLNDWVSGTVPIADILTQQALVNVKMESPFHSPKISFDTEAYFKNTKVTVSESTNKKKNKEAEATMAQRVAAVAKGFAANEKC